MEPVPSAPSRMPEEFDVPYPSREDPDIQSLIYSKTEFRECVSGPNPSNDKKVVPMFFNSQVLYQRVLYAYGSVMLLYEQSSGKTGCFKCYIDYMRKNHPGEIRTTYYVSAKLLKDEFVDQVVFGHFASEEDKELVRKGIKSRKTIAKMSLRRQDIVCLTYGAFAKLIEAYDTTEELNKHFSACNVVIDEFHKIKLSEATDVGTQDREKLSRYKQYWRLSRLCPTCTITLASGTPVTDNINEFIHPYHLLPGVKHIPTPLSKKIVRDVCKDYNIDPKTLGLEEDGLEEDGKMWAEGLKLAGPEPFQWNEDDKYDGMKQGDIIALMEKHERDHKEQVAAFVAEREVALEKLIRGKVMYARAPKTPAVVKYMDDEQVKMLNEVYDTPTRFLGIAYSEVTSKLRSEQVEVVDKIYSSIIEQPEYGDQSFNMALQKVSDTLVKDEKPRFEELVEAIEDARRNHSYIYSSDDRYVERDEFLMKTFTHVTMSEFQTLGYLYTIEHAPVNKKGVKSEGLYISELISGVVVFPSEEYAKYCVRYDVQKANEKYLKNYDFSNSYGGVGFDSCVEYEEKTIQVPVAATRNYSQKDRNRDVVVQVACKWFSDYLADFECLRNSSAILADIVWLIEREEGFPVYIPSKFKEAVLTTLLFALEARGYERFDTNGDLDEDGLPRTERKRVAIISKDSEKSARAILRAWGHPRNAQKKYIAALAVSPIGTTGINIPNAGHCCVTEPEHNSAPTRQAVFRVLRPNSHTELARIVKGYPWFWEEFPVYVHYYMPDMFGYKNDDDLKDLRKLVKGGKNNGLVDNLSGDRDENAWTVAHWRVYCNSHNKEVSEASFFRSIKKCAIDYEMNKGRNMRKDIEEFSFQSDYDTVHYDAYNCDTTLPIDTSTYESYYLSSKQLWDSKDLLAQLAESEYVTPTSMSISNESLTRYEVLYSLRRIVEQQATIGTNRLGLPLTLKEDHGLFYPALDFLQKPSSSLVTYTQTPVLIRRQPVDGLAAGMIYEEKLERIKNKIMSSPVYKDYLTTIPNAYKCALLESVLNKKITRTPLVKWEVRVFDAYKDLCIASTEGDRELVVVHQLSNLYTSGFNYNAVGAVVNPKGNMRICVDSSGPLEGGVWRECTLAENEHYGPMLNKRIESVLNTYYVKFEHIGFIGVIVRSDKVHIRKFTIKEVKNKDGTVSKVYSSRSTGQDIESHDSAAVLFGMLYMLSPEKHNVNVSKEERANLLEYFKERKVGKVKMSAKTFTKWEPAKLRFYYEMNTEKKHEPSVARQICDRLLGLGAIYPLVGDAKLAVEKVK